MNCDSIDFNYCDSFILYIVIHTFGNSILWKYILKLMAFYHTIQITSILHVRVIDGFLSVKSGYTAKIEGLL